MRIAVIPDTQVKPGVATDHITAYTNYIIDHKPDCIVHLGDHWDMHSLSSYDSKAEMAYEHRSYKDDIEAGNEAMKLITQPIEAERKRLMRNRKKQWNPRMVYLMGNHEQRIERAVRAEPVLTDVVTYDDLNLVGWEVYPFLEIVKIDDIRFSHYFINPMSAKKGPLGGTMDTMLKNAGFSFVQGHQQGLKFGRHDLADGTVRQGLVAGSFYQHDEGYMGRQGNRSHWRGAVFMNEVKNGGYDPMMLSLTYLRDHWL